jgi:hypothetical protein
MITDVREAQRPRVVHKSPEHATPARLLADPSRRVVVDARRDEARELGALRVQHAKRRVARAGQLHGRRENPRQHRVEIQVGDDHTPEFDQRAQAIRFELVCDQPVPRSRWCVAFEQRYSDRAQRLEPLAGINLRSGAKLATYLTRIGHAAPRRWTSGPVIG